MIDRILNFIKSLFSIYWKTRPFRAFITLNTLVLVGFSALKITYNFTSEKHSWGIEITQGEYNWIIVIILAIINIPFVIWLLNDLLKAKLELLHKQECKVQVGYFFKDNVVALSPSIERIITSFSVKTPSIPTQIADPMTELPPLQAVLANIARINNNIVQATKLQVIRGEINKSFYPIQFYLENIGVPSLKCFEITFYFGDDVAGIKSNNKKMNNFFLEFSQSSSTHINEEEKTVSLHSQNMLVGSDSIATKPIFVKPTYPTDKITIHWKLLADEFNQTGSFEVPVTYDIIEKQVNRYVDTSDELQDDREDIGDYIEPIS